MWTSLDTEAATYQAAPPVAITPLQISVEQLIELWVHGKSPHTQRYYGREVRQFLKWVSKPLDTITLADVQGYTSVLAATQLTTSSQARAIAAVKSFFTFAHDKLGSSKSQSRSARYCPQD